MGHVVHHLHAEIAPGVAAQHPLERPPRPVGDELAVAEGVVRRRRHRAQVVLPLPGADGGASELLVRQVDAVLLGRLLHHVQVVLARLMAQAPRAAVDEGQHLPRPADAHRLGRLRVEHLVDDLYLQEVVAGAQGP